MDFIQNTDEVDLCELLRWRARENERGCYRFLGDGESVTSWMTHRDLHLRAEEVASRLCGDVSEGERALLLFPPGLDFLPAFFGCLYRGILPIPAPPPDAARLKRALPRLQAILSNAEPTVVLGPSDLLQKLARADAWSGSSIRTQLACDLTDTRRVSPDRAELLDDSSGSLQSLSTEPWGDSPEPLMPEDRIEGVRGRDEELAAASRASPFRHATDVQKPLFGSSSRPAFLQFTSGSTSAPKGVVVTHGNILANCHALLVAAGYSHTSTTLTWMPYFHDYGLIEGLLLPLYLGLPAYVMSSLAFIRKPIRWLRAISRYRVTHSQGPNFAYDLCVRRTMPWEREGLDLSCWQVAANGAEPIRAETLASFCETFAPAGFKPETLSPGYGLAEATLAVSLSRPQTPPLLLQVEAAALERGQVLPATASTAREERRVLVGCGPIVEETRVVIVDPESQQPCPPDRVGEIWVSGPGVTSGYWQQKQATSQTFEARLAVAPPSDAGTSEPAVEPAVELASFDAIGELSEFASLRTTYLRTGDLGFFSQGQLFVTGRFKDLIILQGRNLYPQDLELTVERSHPGSRPGGCVACVRQGSGGEELIILQEVERKILGAWNTRASLPRDSQAAHATVTPAHSSSEVPHPSVEPNGSSSKTSADTFPHAAVHTTAEHHVDPQQKKPPASLQTRVPADDDLCHASTNQDNSHQVRSDLKNVHHFDTQAEDLFAAILTSLSDEHDVVPQAIVLLKAGTVERTSSGKLRRQGTFLAWQAGELEVIAQWQRRESAVTMHHETQDMTTKKHSPSQTELQGWFIDWFARRQGESQREVSCDRPFIELGLDSMLAAELAHDLSVYLGHEISPTSFWNHSTISRLAAHLVSLVPVTTEFEKPASLGRNPIADLVQDHTAQLHTNPPLDRSATGAVAPQRLSGLNPIPNPLSEHSTQDLTAVAKPRQESERRTPGHDDASTPDPLTVPVVNENEMRLNHAESTSCGLSASRLISAERLNKVTISGQRQVTEIRPVSDLESTRADQPQTWHPELTTAEPRPDDIAIVGMGCRLPGGLDDPFAFWNLLAAGRDVLTEIPADRWNWRDYAVDDAQAVGGIYTRFGAFLDEVRHFDAGFFGITPREARGLDPQQRLLLEVAWRTLENAGIPPARMQGDATGVMIGLSSDDYAVCRHTAGWDGADPRALGEARSVAAGRLAYAFDWHGPVMQVDTACSSALMAIHWACQALRAGSCRQALAGGVNLMLSPWTSQQLCQLRALSPGRLNKTFAADADGYVRGEGCVLVLLKRWADAKAAGDRVWSVIRGSATNHDGFSNGLTAPNGLAQQQVIRLALHDAAIDPEQIAYVEAHGSATLLGDPIELEALYRVYGTQARHTPLVVGSAKTNLGHLEAAAGAVGLLKTALSIHHATVPAHLHCQEPNPRVPWAAWQLRIPHQSEPWPVAQQPRFAAVSAFGLSGSNVHLILQSAPSLTRSTPVNKASGHPALPSSSTATTSSAAPFCPESVEHVTGERPWHLLCISARDPAALDELTMATAELLQTDLEVSFADLTHAANTRRNHFPVRRAVVARTAEEAGEGLREQHWHGVTRTVPAVRPRLAMLFTGQGSQHAEMGSQLYATEPVFRRTIDACDELLQPWFPQRLSTLLYEEDHAREADSRSAARLAPVSNSLRPGSRTGWLAEAAYLQPALFAIEWALWELWRSWGIEPDGVLGHSLGEYAAACSAGIFSWEDGLKLVAERGRLMQQLPGGGGMLAVFATEKQVQSTLVPHASSVSLAVINSPGKVVLAGPANQLAALASSLRQTGIRTVPLPVSHAFHSRHVEPILPAFRKVVEAVPFHAPRIPIVSNRDGAMAGERMATVDYWVEQIREPVQFHEGILTLLNGGFDLFLEVGPSNTLTSLGRAATETGHPPRAAEIRWLHSLQPGKEDGLVMLASLAELYLAGREPDWFRFHPPDARSWVDLPGYPFQRQPFWFDDASPEASTCKPTSRPRVHTIPTTQQASFTCATASQQRVVPTPAQQLDGTPLAPEPTGSHLSPVWRSDERSELDTAPANTFGEHAAAASRGVLGGSVRSPHTNSANGATRATTSPPAWLPSPAELKDELQGRLAGVEGVTALLRPQLDRIAAAFMLRAVKQLADLSANCERFSPETIIDRLPARHRPKLRRIFKHLLERGTLVAIAGDYWLKEEDPEATPEAWLADLEHRCPCPELKLVRRAGHQLPAILRGEVEALTLLFPAGGTAEAAEFYSESPLFRGYNQVAAEILGRLADRCPADRPLRVLEVGAGTGGFTSHVLPRLAGHTAEYLFTDLSPLLLNAAEERFAAFDFLRTARLDISRSWDKQVALAEPFDLVLAANVVHATPELRVTLKHVREGLREGGWLVLLEGTQPPLWGDMVFALIDGWWLFRDFDLRPDYPLLSAPVWQTLLEESGFSAVVKLTDSSRQSDPLHTLFLAQAGPAAARDSTAANNATRSVPSAMATAAGHEPVFALEARPSHEFSTRRESAGNEWPANTTFGSVPLGTRLDGFGQRESLVVVIRDFAARVMRLPSSTIDPHKPLVRQGLDSLMAIELRTIVERELKAELPVRLLMDLPSIDDLATYLIQQQTVEQLEAEPERAVDEKGEGNASTFSAQASGPDRPPAYVGSKVLVRLQAAGDSLPLFFIPAGYGDLLAFQDVARFLGGDQPVFGLQPPGAKQIKNVRHMSIHRLVSTYIDEIKKVQASGPYALAGYSAGGMIAIELARELTRRGETVELLAALDPPAHVPFWLDSLYTTMYRFCARTRLLNLVRRWGSRTTRRWFHAMLDEGLRTHTAVTAAHDVTPFTVRLTHFRAKRSWVRILSWQRTGQFWRSMAQGGYELHWIPGTHYGMLRGPSTEVLAEELRDCLLRSRQSPATP